MNAEAGFSCDSRRFRNFKDQPSAEFPNIGRVVIEGPHAGLITLKQERDRCTSTARPIV